MNEINELHEAVDDIQLEQVSTGAKVSGTLEVQTERLCYGAVNTIEKLKYFTGPVQQP